MINNNDKRKEKVAEITQQLEKGVQELQTSSAWKDYLNVMTKFHSYSANNCLLIFLQCPGATHVAGFKAWNKFNRHVKKGEKAIKILAPCPIKIKVEQDGEEVERVIPRYRPVAVFDLEQTDGEELPTMPVHILTGDVKDFDTVISTLESVSPVSVSYEPIDNGANGYYSYIENRIVIKSDLSQEQTIKTLIHEIAHSILHNKEDGVAKDSERHIKEVQAESIAYTVCNYFGLDTSDYSFGYVTSWTRAADTKELQQNIEVIRKTAHEIIESIEHIA